MDAYASVGMPVSYNHWSFGKHFLSTEKSYRRGQMGLAYEIVINSNPCIAYLMEENSLTMQALVIAHAAMAITPFSRAITCSAPGPTRKPSSTTWCSRKNYIAECEQRHGVEEVELAARFLPCAAKLWRGPLQAAGPAVDDEENARQKEREAILQSQVNDLWRTLPRRRKKLPTATPQRRVSAGAAGKPAVFHREVRAAARAVAARNRAHHAQDFPVFLSAAPDPGDERRLGHVLALHHPEPAVRRRRAAATAS